jgi:O-acetylhomoserine/O-acetylserine sulfhydrylase-like pyridoxal-dependent enzyme
MGLAEVSLGGRRIGIENVEDIWSDLEAALKECE